MKISRVDLQRIIVEEYAKEEGIDEALSPERSAEVLAWLKGQGPRPDWLTDDYGSSAQGKAVQSPASPNVDRSAETMPFPADSMPQYDDEPDEEGAYDTEAESPESNIEDQIASLVQGMPPEEISDLFQAVFSKIPGVEIGTPEEEEADTLYTPGAGGRPQAGFKEELANKAYARILEMAGLSYGTHSMAGIPGKRDDDYKNLSDAELINMAEKDGIEEIIVLDGEGDLANREEVIAALKDV